MVLMVGCDGAPLPKFSNTITGQIVGVHDGDSYTLLTESKEQFKIRLDGIDAPELGQPQGRQGKATLSDLEMSRRVTVQDNGKDLYQRTLGVVMVDGKNVNLEMIRLGYAWHYLKYSKDKALAEAEKEARAGKRGLWADRLPVPPWDWRRK
jgi:micrococcal nuclease